MTITVSRLAAACRELRDEITAETAPGSGRALVWPLALDMVASSPEILTRLAEKLSERGGG